jgi:hypothetical protein
MSFIGGRQGFRRALGGNRVHVVAGVWRCSGPFRRAPLNVTDASAREDAQFPAMKSLESLVLTDEHYQLKTFLRKEDVCSRGSSRSVDFKAPSFIARLRDFQWRGQSMAGRVFYSTLGHLPGVVGTTRSSGGCSRPFAGPALATATPRVR